MADNTKDLYSVLSKASYDFYHHGLPVAQKELNSYSQTKGYSIDSKLSNKNAVVLEKGNDIVISYRGTDLKNPSDILADAEILLGRDKIKIFLNDRFDEADQLFQKVKAGNPNKTITLTGHSLGSAEAIYVGTKHNQKSISFNEGTSPLDALLSRFGSKETDSKQIVYITGKDIISNLTALEPYDVRYVSAKNDLNFLSHSLNYFLPEKETPVPDYLKTTYYPKYKPKKLNRYADLNNQFGIDYFRDLAKQRAEQVY